MGARLVDPLAVYVAGLNDPDAVGRLPQERKRVAIPWADAQGAIHPAGSRVVWPVPCRPR